VRVVGDKLKTSNLVIELKVKSASRVQY